MQHRLTAALLGLVLLLPAGAVTAPAASAAEDRAAPAAARAATPRATVARTVRVGHDPVRIRSAGPKKTVRLTFRGTKGQFLNLALWAKRGTATFGRPPCATWELRRGRHVVESWAPGYWKVPRTATYVATVEPCERLTGRAQLRTVVLFQVVGSLDGDRLRQVARLVDVVTQVLRRVVGQQLQRDGEQDRVELGLVARARRCGARRSRRGRPRRG